jgi:hypothetical protein
MSFEENRHHVVLSSGMCEAKMKVGCATVKQYCVLEIDAAVVPDVYTDVAMDKSYTLLARQDDVGDIMREIANVDAHDDFLPI